jgi:hypothetical protein
MLARFLPSFFLARLSWAAIGVLVLAACSPTFNWREVPIADAGLVALMPCKADRANRMLPLGAESVPVDMTGCEAGGATFAVAHATATSQAQAEAWIEAWRKATRGQLAAAAGAAPPLAEASAAVARAAASPAPAQLEAGGKAPVRVLWFAQPLGGAVAVYQATVLGQPSSGEAAKTFFDGLHLP